MAYQGVFSLPNASFHISLASLWLLPQPRFFVAHWRGRSCQVDPCGKAHGSGPGETQGFLKRGTTSGGWIRSMHSSSRYWSASEGKSAAVAATLFLAPLKNVPLSAARKNEPMGLCFMVKSTSRK